MMLVDMNTPAHAWQGDNRTLEQQARDAIAAALDALRPRLEALIASGLQCQAIADQKTAAGATDLVAMFQALSDDVDEAHRTVKAPYLASGEIVDGETGGFRERLDFAKRRIEGMLNRFQLDLADRILAERAEERAAEADDPEPAVVPHDVVDMKVKTTIRGTRGASAHLHDKHWVERVDYAALDPEFLKRKRIADAIEREALYLRRQDQPVKGVTYGSGKRTQVRRG